MPPSRVRRTTRRVAHEWLDDEQTPDFPYPRFRLRPRGAPGDDAIRFDVARLSGAPPLDFAPGDRLILAHDRELYEVFVQGFQPTARPCGRDVASGVLLIYPQEDVAHAVRAQREGRRLARL
jgi:hypothetical protein